MPPEALTDTTRFQVYTERQFDRIEALRHLPEEQRFAMRVVANVLPFRVNQYVIDELIDWERVPEDPVFQLTFPQPGMLHEADFNRMAGALRRGAERAEIKAIAREIQAGLNPHPAGQQQMNVPQLNGEPLPGVQHKYRETVLFFPSQGQVCHSYCTFCFRWAQFVGDKALRFAANEASNLHRYLAQHTAISDLLVTGGDPMVMKTDHLKAYLEPLLRPELEHVQTVRIGTKSLTFWPQRFVTDSDADELLRLLEKLVAGGKHVALMAHFNHWREMATPIAREAMRRIRATGAQIRTQAPLLRHINDDPEVWARLWRTQVHLGLIPYYMFVERDTGARQYFEVPLVRAWEIYREAMQQVSGLGRTARGPSMSAGPGKVEIQGVTEIQGEKVFVLRFIQGRNPDWVQQPFFARYDPGATWLDQLEPAFGAERFFFEDEYRAMQQQRVKVRRIA
ncbi:KamA family radical SAM protein [Thiohalobacter thiocyanaticus]|uniref:Lysine 2,3-aminomutase n=1 Tax=Thiohalobacter thiocyanaticus TaxID=585455 RepID=A0A426QMV3_9GAMM|nr:lysine 2,3-aminomutase [Thiohalobacter thiocyanaticus]RRQ23084.1 lysine 2,3-aminomutase [Thiohalobacter thiocyanaticus]